VGRVCGSSGPRNRLELVRERTALRISTTRRARMFGAVVKSVEGFARPVILIAGGYDKGSDFGPLFDLFRRG